MIWKYSASALLSFAAFLAAPPASPAQTLGDRSINPIRIGIANHYKVGHWTPVRVEVNSDSPAQDPQVEVIVPDSDGVETVSAAPLLEPTTADGLRSATVYTKMGQTGAPIRVVLADDGEQFAENSLSGSARRQLASGIEELPPNAELVASLGAAIPGIDAALALRDSRGGQLARRIVRIERIADLPDRWFGYDSVDVLVIAADDSRLWSELAADTDRMQALVRWIELGGRVLVLCSGEYADALLAAGKPLAPLLPAKFAEVVRLPETGRLEHFANSEAPIVGRGRRTTITVPRLVDVDGAIEAFAGQRPTDLPLVVRAPRGLGEVAFAGVDLAKPPLAAWPGRDGFVRALLRPYVSEANTETGPQTLVARGYNDLSGALRQRLGRSFRGVAPITFPIVTVLAIAYLVVLGPLDYLLIHRWLRRPLAAWITFPLAVVIFTGAGLALADWRKGDAGARVNRVELVDIDLASGQARGTFWATLYTPRASEFDIELELDKTPISGGGQASPEILLSSWGLPGAGIGGMQARRTDLGAGEGEYRYARDFSALEGVPVLTAATKSLLARWHGPAGSLVDARLVDEDGLLTGKVENRSGRMLRNLRLLYGRWAYRLGHMAPGQTVDVGERIAPRWAKTLVAQDALGSGAPALSEGIIFDAERATIVELLKLIMFYEVAGGLGFAGLPSHYQAYCDLSRTLEVGRAILVADVETPGSRLVDANSGRPLDAEQEAAAVVYRFVLPVENGEQASR